MAAKKVTRGVSPKAPAATVGALLAPAVAALIARLFGIEVADATVELGLTALISAVGALAGAYVAPPGAVVTASKKQGEAGYGAVEVLLIVFLALICLVVLARLL